MFPWRVRVVFLAAYTATAAVLGINLTPYHQPTARKVHANWAIHSISVVMWDICVYTRPPSREMRDVPVASASTLPRGLHRHRGRPRHPPTLHERGIKLKPFWQ